MTLRLSEGLRDRMLGLSTAGNAVLLGEDTTTSDLSASWTATTVTLTGNNNVDGRTGVLSISAAAGDIEQAISVVPGHTYRLTYDQYSTPGATDALTVNIGTSSGGTEIYSSGAITTAAATWTSQGDATNVSVQADQDDGGITFTAGATTETVYLSFNSAGTTDTMSFDNIRLIDVGSTIGDIFADGRILIYSGTQPSSANDAVTGTLLCRIDANIGSGAAGDGLLFGDSSSGVVAKDTGQTWSGLCVATNTAGWARLIAYGDGGASSSILPRIDMGIATSGSQLNFTSTAFATGAVQTITGYTITFPAQ